MHGIYGRRPPEAGISRDCFERSELSMRLSEFLSSGRYIAHGDFQKHLRHFSLSSSRVRSKLRREVEDLEEEVAALSLLNRALLQLLEEKGIINPEEFSRKHKELLQGYEVLDEDDLITEPGSDAEVEALGEDDLVTDPP
jgi:hypothetical protein